MSRRLMARLMLLGVLVALMPTAASAADDDIILPILANDTGAVVCHAEENPCRLVTLCRNGRAVISLGGPSGPGSCTKPK